MPRDADDDRPKKSWREIDAGRDKRGSGGGASGGPSERTQRSAAYRSYKSQLNKLFDGGALPEALQGKLADSPVASDAKRRKTDAAAVTAATTPKAFAAALDAYVAAHGFPREEDVLARVLDMGGEAHVGRAVETLAELVAEQTLKKGASFKVRLKTAQLTVDDPAVREGIGALLRKL